MVSQVNLKCDFGKGVSEDIYARYGESGRVVNFDFVNSNIEGGVVDVSNARFCLVKSDGNFVIQDFDNSVGLDLTSNMCASSGVGSYEVQVSVDGVVVSGRGSFIVSDRVWNDEVVESVSEGNGLVFPDDFQEKLETGEGIKIEGNVISWDGTVDWARWYKEMKEWREASLIFGEAKFETVEEGLLKELVVGVESVQDLHGYDYPWIGGAGKNLLPMTVDRIKSANTSGTWNGNSYTVNGVTFEVLTDNDGNVIGIRVNGTASAITQFLVVDNNTIKNGNYILNGLIGNGDASSYLLRIVNSDTYSIIAQDEGQGYSFSLSSNTITWCDIRIANGFTASDLTFYPMIRLATETDPTFEPYTNICPISGWNSVDVSLKDGDGVSQREYSIALGQTVYGGVLDVVNGKLRIEKVSVIFDGSSDEAWTMNNNPSDNRRFSVQLALQMESVANAYSITKAISNLFISSSANATWDGGIGISQLPNGDSVRVTPIGITNVTSFKTWLSNNNLQIVYPLATPITIQLPPQEILSLEGENNISADSRDMLSCVYSKIANYISARSVFMDNGETVQKAVSDLQ